jgi:hypothetical protein
LIKNDIEFAYTLAEDIDGYSDLYISLIKLNQIEEAKSLITSKPTRLDLGLIIEHIPTTDTLAELFGFLQQGIVRKETQTKSALINHALTY